jgi:tetratricopeptide (TPR) repeat protein
MSFLSVFSPSLRPLNPLSALFLSLAFSASLSADVIYLTNGNVMVVEKAWEESGEVKYQTGQGVQSLPKSSVRRIQEQKPTHGHAQQKYGIAAEDGNRAAQSVPKLLTEISSNVPSKAATKEVLIRLRENLKSDPSDAHSKAELVLALNSVAALQLTQGDFSSAKSSLEEALALDRRNSILLSNLAVANFQMGNFRAAEDLLLTSLEIDRKNQGTYYLLGEAYYAQEKIPQAISQWTTALQLGANSQISERLEKARYLAKCSFHHSL